MKFRTGSSKIVANAEGFSGHHWPSGERQPWDPRGFGRPQQPKIEKPEDQGKEEPMDKPHRTARDLYT